MEYCIVGARNSWDLTGDVKDKIKDGWVPLGGMTTATWPGSGPTFHQTMIKEKVES